MGLCPAVLGTIPDKLAEVPLLRNTVHDNTNKHLEGKHPDIYRVQVVNNFVLLIGEDLLEVPNLQGTLYLRADSIKNQNSSIFTFGSESNDILIF